MDVIKMNGEKEPTDISKINKQLHRAVEGLNASASLLAVRSQIKIIDGMETSRIQDILIETAKSLITKDTPDYSIVAARLMVSKLRKIAYGHYTPPSIEDHIQHCIEIGKYDTEILKKWSPEDLEKFNSAINHDLDNNLHLAAMNQLLGKYIMKTVKNDHTTAIESPQMVYMVIAMTLHDTVDMVVDTYYEFSRQNISLPTPIMAGVRSPSKQFSSCVLVDTGDSLKSISHTSSNIIDYVSNRAGIGMNMGRIRGIGSSIGNGGEKEHTGILPFLKLQVSALKSCSQGGVRGGSGTAYFPMWHWEIEDILTWKNNRGTEENRVRRCDYGVQINDTMFERLLKDDDIYLFDPVEKLYESYFKTKEDFDAEYENSITLYKAGLIRGKVVKAVSLFTQFVDARFETGRYYPFFVNTVNDLSPFDTYPIYISNLCLEIALPTYPAENDQDENGMISLCTLMSINMSKFLTLNSLRFDLPKTMNIAVRTLDKLLSYQDYLSPHSKRTNDWFRTLGIGIVNLADYLAQLNCRYGSQKALDAVNEFWAAMYYHGKKTSIELAKEYGACGKSDELSPLTHFKHDAKFNLPKQLNLSPLKIHYDFEKLQSDFEKYGTRNATNFAVAPTESSSQLLNATNGAEMPRNVVTIKGSKDSVGSAQVIPSPEIADQYDYLWDQKTPENYLKTLAVIGRWCDQSISTNTPYNPAHFKDGKIPRIQLINDILLAWKLGMKTLYYNIVNDNATDQKDDVVVEIEVEDDCGGACKI